MPDPGAPGGTPIAAVAAILVLATSCGAGDQPSALPLRPGLYSLTLIGYDLTNTPAITPCNPAAVPPEGKIVNTPIVIAQEGDELVGRSQSAQAGTLELRLRRAGTGNSEPVTGTIRGTAIDAGLGPALPKPVQVSLAGSANGAATVDGSMPQTTFALGRIQGSIRFANTSGAFSDCPMVDWTLNEGVR